MAAILTRTVREFASLNTAIETAVEAHDADAVAGRLYVASLPWGFVGILADGTARELETGIRGTEPVVFA